jgi:hypothetical protein
MARTYKDISDKYLSVDELIERNRNKKSNSQKKLRVQLLILNESQLELQHALSNYKINGGNNE